MKRLLATLEDTQPDADPQFIARLRDEIREVAFGHVDSPIDTTDESTEETIMKTLESDQRDDRTTEIRRSPLRYGIAAAAVVILGVGAFYAASDDGPEDPATQAETFSAATALRTGEAYFAGIESGDAAAVVELFTSDATFGDSGNQATDRGAWELRLIWTLAQGGELTPRDCSVTDEVPGLVATVSCEYGALDALGLAVGAENIPTITTLTVSVDGITALHHEWGFPDYTATGLPFNSWMTENHPDDAEAAGCCRGETAEESVARGEIRARFADEWADFLEANDCSYLLVSTKVISGDGTVTEGC